MIHPHPPTQSPAALLPHIPKVPPLPPAEEAPPIAPPQLQVYLPEKRVWRYKILTYDLRNEPLPSATTLDQLGDEGWELTAVLPLGNAVHFYFKLLQ
ncbi:MAG: hypothetical protein R3C14_53265 [Caldilineaceae bacterium]